MGLGQMFVIEKSTVARIRACYNLLLVAGFYSFTVLVLALMVLGLGWVMDWLAVPAGIDGKTRELMSYAFNSVFVALTLAGTAIALGDVVKLVLYYKKDWSSSHDPARLAQKEDQD